MVKRALLLTAIAVVAAAAIAIGRTLILAGPTTAPKAAATVGGDPATTQAMAERLGEAIRIKTVSFQENADIKAAAFEEFLAFLGRSYPAAFRVSSHEIVAGRSLILKWPASEASAPPIALIAHIDVVPVESGTLSDWSHPPFSGEIAEDAVWGRGAMDDKGPLIAILEAVERLAKAGFAPKRDIYLLFGHDEELGGENGAAAIAALLKSRGVHFEWTLDEGSGVVQGVVTGVASPLALISVAEKGSVTLKVAATAPGGHSSAPGKETAVSLVSHAVVALADHPFPLEIDADFARFLHAIAPELLFGPRLVLSNLWLTAPLVKAQLGADPSTAAALHTTTAPTIISGGEKVNILPQRAEAYVNVRIHPRDSVEGVITRAQRLIDDDRIEIAALGGREPSPKSSASSAGYAAIARASEEIFGTLATAPFLTLQGTDTRNYVGLADDYYRFTPFIYEKADLARIHGTDERLKIIDLERSASWYEALLKDVAG